MAIFKNKKIKPTAAENVMMNSIVDCPRLFFILFPIFICSCKKPGAIIIGIKVEIMFIGGVLKFHRFIKTDTFIQRSSVTVRVLHPFSHCNEETFFSANKILKTSVII